MTVSKPMPGVGAELAAAVRRVNAAFSRLPTSTQDSIEIRYDGLDREIDAAILAGDRERARRAIRAWRGHWLATFERAPAPATSLGASATPHGASSPHGGPHA